MSYKKNKIKRSFFNSFRYKSRIIFNKFFYKTIRQRKGGVDMRMVQNVLNILRVKNRLIKANNLKINEWVDAYVTGCFLNGKTVNILTQWCLSRSLKKRFVDQGDKFIPTKKERKIIETEIPELISVFKQNGLRVNWLITFNRAFLDSGLLSQEIEIKYKKMITGLALNSLYNECVLFLDWEDDFLGAKPSPDEFVLKNYFGLVQRSAFNMRLEQMAMWAEREAGLDKTKEQLEKDIVFEAACEANEAKALLRENSLFGKDDFIIIPLEIAERYDNFTISVKDFKKRLVCVLPTYPWRITM